MEAVKLGRRRISDLDCDGYRLMKRRMNGTCHLEGNGTAASGGNWHMNLMSDKTLVNSNTNSASKQQQQPMGFNHQHHHANGVDPQAAVVMVHQQQGNSNVATPQQAPPPPQAALMESASSSQQLLSSMSHPVLPPSLRESERMQSVERWINSIPLDAPIYVQTSLTQIVPITDPKSFPDDLSIADLPPSSNNNAPSSNSAVNAAGDSSRGNYDYYSHNATAAAASNSGNHSHHQSHHLGSPQGGYARAYQQPAPGVENPNSGKRGGVAVNPGGGVGGPPNRFFNDYETQFVVKLFSDYFASGSCPSLNEVRLRMAHSQLQGRRNANSVRAKVKRLQANGRWRTYENM